MKKTLYEKLKGMDEKSADYKENLRITFEKYKDNAIMNGVINGEYELGDILNGNFEMSKEENKLVKDSNGNIHKRNFERKLNRSERRKMKNEVESYVPSVTLEKTKNGAIVFASSLPGVGIGLLCNEGYKNRLEKCINETISYDILDGETERFIRHVEYLKNTPESCKKNLFNSGPITGGILVALGVVLASKYLALTGKRVVDKVKSKIKYVDNKIKEAYNN